MADEAPKSALELAMERLRQRDAESGAGALHLTEDQKAEIAEVRRVYAARIAEREIMHRAKLASVWDPAERQALDEEFRRDLRRLNEERDAKIERVRQSGGGAPAS